METKKLWALTGKIQHREQLTEGGLTWAWHFDSLVV